MLNQILEILSQTSTGVANYPHWGDGLRSLRRCQAAFLTSVTSIVLPR